MHVCGNLVAYNVSCCGRFLSLQTVSNAKAAMNVFVGLLKSQTDKYIQ